MSDLMTRFPAGAAVRAIRFPTTVQAVESLGGPRMPLAFVVAVESGKVAFIGWRKSSLLWDIPVSNVQSISVAETRSSPPFPQVALAIVLTVQTSTGLTELPIVPVADDGEQSLTWKDREVRALAKRLSDAMATEPGIS
ncbi:hypothetical protein [Microbacterium hydrocarbonoxydans]|uniref:hypothetical protein n=1 Tax=Microbacterium hydrocarbonoxydans TaxID=273678 RepID=UPI001269ED0E|nr:hypothetical protein [Microbacterium hydrocarbonoxydans]